MKILLIGANGQLGREICRSRLPSGVKLIPTTRAQLDLTRPEDIAGFMHEAAPDLIINAAAYTAVDKAELEPDLAFAVNRDGAAALAQAAAQHDAAIVHVSTDYVFGGDKDGEWTEDDRPNPVNIYGESKLDGELAVIAANRRHLIIRTSWLYAAEGNNFLKAMLRLGRERSHIAVVNDQIGRPTSAADLAPALIGMALQTLHGEGEWGIYHFSNGGEPTSWHGFASAIFSYAARWSSMPPILDPISTRAFGARAARPRNSCLDLCKIERVYGLRPRSWQAGLAEILDELRREDTELRAS